MQVMSGATATSADEACCAEERDSAAWREPRSALSEIALRHHSCVLARIRLTRTAAERGPVLFGACGQGSRWWKSTDCGCWGAPTHTRPQTRKRLGAWSVDAG